MVDLDDFRILVGCVNKLAITPNSKFNNYQSNKGIGKPLYINQITYNPHNDNYVFP